MTETAATELSLFARSPPLANSPLAAIVVRARKSWADAQANLPSRARWIAKASVAPEGSNEAGYASNPTLPCRAICPRREQVSPS